LPALPIKVLSFLEPPPPPPIAVKIVPLIFIDVLLPLYPLVVLPEEPEPPFPTVIV
jgi:hypothetical protein